MLLVLGGIVKITLSFQETFNAWLMLSILYSILYMPTLSLTNSMAFAHLNKPDSEWPRIRVMGTFGWIAASWLFPMIWLQTNLEFQILPPFFVGTEVPDATARLADTLKVSGTISILYAGFCFLLPNTPPQKEGVEKLAFKKAFSLFFPKNHLLYWSPQVCLLQSSTKFISCKQDHSLRTNWAYWSLISPGDDGGQFAEIGVMAFLGIFLAKLGFRWTITIGALAYFARYAIWGFISMQEAVGPR
ncbi:MAG: hypothetical protein CM1200mP40_17850 [Gammaproteobacteria bacterium]|nr:MAG: hypothetical protein CM1200mP40_17850 [Gammaproteobacteria bacterium]